MKFRTEIKLSLGKLSLSHFDKVQMLGSCFVENISTKLLDSAFVVDVNPFGIMYNPLSIARGLERLLDIQKMNGNDLFFSEGVYHSFLHHSRFSGTEKTMVLETMNKQIQSSSIFLREASCLIITFGTANVYRLQSSGEVVSNCHKLPAKLFREERLSIDEITKEWIFLLEKLKAVNPCLRILFTVSPIRHWKDGAHENQLNKSTLLLAVNELVKSYSDCHYFPSYEIMMDDLRDYRFYAEDMIHPNQQAIHYIWEKFGEAYFDTNTQSCIKEWERIQRQLNHRPFNSDSKENKAFWLKAKEQESDFLKRYRR